MGSYKSRSRSASSRKHSHRSRSGYHSHSGRGKLYHSHTHHHHRSHHDSSHHNHSHRRKEYHHDHKRRHRANSRRHDTNSYSYKGSHVSYNADSDRDDSIGHFHGSKGDIIGNKYVIEGELGMGTFAKTFKVFNKEDNKYYAVKVVRAIPRYCRHAKIEASIMKDITERDTDHFSHCSRIYDQFEFNGHYCMVMDVLGKSLLDVVKENDYKPFPIKLIRPILQHLFECLQFLQRIDLTHTDLKLENVLFESSEPSIDLTNQDGDLIHVPNTTNICVIDFGSSTYANQKRCGIINTRQYRAPEVLLGLEWDEESDIWGAACIAMELFTGALLFQTHDDLLHFALIEKIVGRIPEKMLKLAGTEFSRYFDESGRVRLDELHRSELEQVEEQPTLKELVGKDFPNFLDLMEHCLILAPERRITPSEALMHPFFSDKD